MNKDPFEHLLDYLFELSGVDVFVEITSWSFFTLKGDFYVHFLRTEVARTVCQLP